MPLSYMVNNIKGYGIGQASHQKTNMDCFTVFISYFFIYKWGRWDLNLGSS